MPKSRGRRIRRSEKQWQEILRRFDSSRLNAREFCQREGLSLSSLQRRRQRPASAPSAGLVEMVAPADPAASAPG